MAVSAPASVLLAAAAAAVAALLLPALLVAAAPPAAPPFFTSVKQPSMAPCGPAASPAAAATAGVMSAQLPAVLPRLRVMLGWIDSGEPAEAQQMHRQLASHACILWYENTMHTRVPAASVPNEQPVACKLIMAAKMLCCSVDIPAQHTDMHAAC